jgi:hypothetical protein
MKTLEDFFYDLPPLEQTMVDRLRQIVLDAVPDFEEKLSYGVPYYFRNTRVCFIWPSSVKPGPKSGVVLGFCKGYLLSNEQGLLEAEGRKEVYMITFHQPAEIDERAEAVQEIIHEAVLVDEQSPRRRR